MTRRIRRNLIKYNEEREAGRDKRQPYLPAGYSLSHTFSMTIDRVHLVIISKGRLYSSIITIIFSVG